MCFNTIDSNVTGGGPVHTVEWQTPVHIMSCVQLRKSVYPDGSQRRRACGREVKAIRRFMLVLALQRGLRCAAGGRAVERERCTPLQEGVGYRVSTCEKDMILVTILCILANLGGESRMRLRETRRRARKRGVALK